MEIEALPTLWLVAAIAAGFLLLRLRGGIAIAPIPWPPPPPPPWRPSEDDSGDQGDGSNPPVADGRLFALLIGVDSYIHSTPANGGFDAVALADVFRAQMNHPHRPYTQVFTRLLVNRSATARRILDEIKSFFEPVRAGDTVLLFFSGHGDQEETYFYYCHDGNIKEGARVSATDMCAELAPAQGRAARTIIINDTCHAGAMRPDTKAGVEWTDILGKNVYILSSCRPFELSWTEAPGGHGVFSRALLEALAGAADHEGDGFVSLAEAIHYTGKRVQEQSVKLGHSQIPYSQTAGPDFPLVAV